MKKLLIIILPLFILSCSGPRAGLIPMGQEKNPDISSKYIEMGAFFDKSSKSNMDYPEFANKKCRDFGRDSYKAYKFGYASGMVLGYYPIGLPITDIARTANIWCR
jgi:hypothetical protein